MVFLVNMARLVFAPLVQPAAEEFGVAAASLGVVTSAAWLGSAAPRLPTGFLLTRAPRHRVILATGALLVGTAAVTALAGSVAHLAVGAFLMGLSSGMYFIAANPLVSELFPDEVGTAIGIHGLSSQLAAVGIPLAVSAVLFAGGWRTIFLLIAATAAAATVGLYWAARRTDLPEAGADDRSLVAAGRAQWPTILTGVAFVGAAGFLWNGLFNLYGDYLEVAKGIDPGTGRLLLSLTFAAGLPAFVVTGRLADRLPNVPLLLAITGGFALAVFGLTVAEGLAAIAVASVGMGYAIHSLFPAVDTYLLASLPDRHRASAYALFSATAIGVQAFGSGVVGTAVAGTLEYTTVFQLLAGGVAAVVLGLWALYREGRLPAGGRPGEVPAAEGAD